MQAVGELDEERGEFWISNPWKMSNDPFNVSAYERNQVFLQIGPGLFSEIGHLTGADSEGDGRGTMVADVDGDLQPDVLVRHSGGGPLTVWANRFPPAQRLVVSLRGTESNGVGIGAIVEAEVGDRTITRQMYPTNNFASSQPAQVEFGLGSSPKVDRLTVRWPSGTVQSFPEVAAGRHLRITEGKEGFDVLLAPGEEPAPVRLGALD